jgi:hypothetical protein
MCRANLNSKGGRQQTRLAIYIHQVFSFKKTLWRQWDRLCIISEILYLEWRNEQDSSYLLIVPQSLQKQVLHNYHDIPSAGHLGTEKDISEKKKPKDSIGLL